MSPYGTVHNDHADDDGDDLLHDERSPAFTKGPGASQRHGQESGVSRNKTAAGLWPETSGGAEFRDVRSPSPARSDVSGVEAFQDWGTSDDEDVGIHVTESMDVQGQGTVRTPSPRE